MELNEDLVRGLESEAEITAQRTLIQQRAKKRCIDKLLAEELPIPQDLTTEFCDYIRQQRCALQS